MKLRWVIGGALALLFALGVAFLLLEAGSSMPRQQINLPSGGSFIFTETTFGTNHVTGSPLFKIVQKLPRPIEQWIRRFAPNVGQGDRRISSKPTLMFWYEVPPSPGTHYAEASIADENGFVAGSKEFLHLSVLASDGVAAYDLLPRRSHTLNLYIREQSWQQPKPPTLILTNVPNPAFGNYPQWQPESLPATKRADDLDVTLLRFATDLSQERHTTHRSGVIESKFSKRQGSDECYSLFEVEFKGDGKPQPNWTVASTTLSDATGNTARNSSMSGSGPGFYLVAPALWPGEAAWKLTLNLKRTSGFSTNNLFTFHNVPMRAPGETTTLTNKTNFAGITISLDKIVLHPNRSREEQNAGVRSELFVRHSELPEGLYLDLLEARCGTNRLDFPSRSWSSQSQSYGFENIPADARTIDLSFALHPGRTVEFMVEPVIAETDLVFSQKRD